MTHCGQEAGAQAAVTSENVCAAPSSDDNCFTICGTKSFSQSKAKDENHSDSL